MLNLPATVILALAVTLISCNKLKVPEPGPEPPKKNTPLTSGLPGNFRETNAYVFAGVDIYQYSGAPESFAANCYAAFSDPARNLISGFNHYIYQNVSNPGQVPVQGNIFVGNVTLNSMMLEASSFSPTVVYRLNNSNTINFDYSARWKWPGNNTFQETDLLVERGFPRITTAATPTTLSRSKDFQIDVPSTFSNYDSIVVFIGGGSSLYYTVKKSVAFPAQNLTFTSSELSTSLSNYSSCYIHFYAFNYSHRSVEGIEYVYELSSHVRKFLYVNP